ncbi:protease modulator HflK [uncultured Tolumonas sp.]|uniref:protease modulator HflK n=1 Tax=uncultured Tolumonas sp. TaxID=263765 RepID=UPI002A0A6290|nr:protease modulator HflK [uncultured Tolumonas sp.]
MGNPSSRQSPWAQSYRIAFFTLYAATLLAAAAWFFSSTYRIAPDSQAVVFHFGEPIRLEHAGLLLAWPQPIDQVIKIPGPERIIEHPVMTMRQNVQLGSTPLQDVNDDTDAGSGYLLTGDTGIVQLDIRLFYQVTDPISFAIQQSHIDPLLDRLATRAAAVVCASRDLDTILVARPEIAGNEPKVAEARLKLRGDFKQAMNDSLAELANMQTEPGIRIERVDIASSLPGNAVSAFNAVLTASQQAEKNIADARNTAALRLQNARQNADRLIQQAQASSQETLAQAMIDTETINRLAHSSDSGLLQRLYRDKIAEIFTNAGKVITISPGEDSHLILPGAPAPQVTSTSLAPEGK